MPEKKGVDWQRVAAHGIELEKEHEKEKQQERLRCVSCPDCGAHLKIDGPGELPEGTELKFVEHAK